MIATLLLGASLAVAGVPLVYDQAASADAVERVAARTGLPAVELDPVPVDTVLRSTPRVVGGAALRHCAGSPARAPEIRSTLVRAEAAWLARDAALAMDQADLGITNLGCLVDRLEPDVAARLFLLRGGLLLQEGDAEGARAEIRAALAQRSDLAWDERLPPGGDVLLDTVRAEAVQVSLSVVPRPVGNGPWIDGRDAPTDGAPMHLGVGLHLLQVASTAGLRSAWLTVEGDATLVIPGAFLRPVLGYLADPAARAPVERLLLSTQGDAVYAVEGAGIWLVALEDGVPVTTELVTLPPVAEPVPSGRRGRRGRD